MVLFSIPFSWYICIWISRKAKISVSLTKNKSCSERMSICMKVEFWNELYHDKHESYTEPTFFPNLISNLALLFFAHKIHSWKIANYKALFLADAIANHHENRNSSLMGKGILSNCHVKVIFLIKAPAILFIAYLAQIPDSFQF